MTPTEESPTHQAAPIQTQHQQHFLHSELMAPARAKLVDVNEYLTCHLCRGYLIDATTITECLHSFCRSCILKFLQDNSHCPVCDLVINTAKPNLKPDKTMQDIVYKLVPELFLREMERRRAFYRAHPAPNAAAGDPTTPVVKLTPEQRGEDTERTIFNAKEMFSLSLEYASEDNSLIHSPITGGHLAAAVAPRTREEHVRSARTNNGTTGCGGNGGARLEENGSLLKRYLYCPGMCRIDVLKKFVSTKYNVNCTEYYIDILYKRVPLPGHYTLIDIAYIYSWKRNAPMKFFFRISDLSQAKDNCEYYIPLKELSIALANSNANIGKSTGLKAVKKTVHKARIKTTPEVVQDKKRDIQNNLSKDIATVISSQKEDVVQNQAKKEVVPPNNKTDDPVESTIQISSEKVAPSQEIPSKVIDPSVNDTQLNIVKNDPPEENHAKVPPVNSSVPQIDKPNPEKPQQKPVKLIINVPKHLTSLTQQTSTNNTNPSNQNMNTTIKASKASPTKPKIDQDQLVPIAPPTILPNSKPPIDIKFDEEKQNFLKSFELAARNSLPASAIPKSPPAKNIANEMKQYKLTTEIKQIRPLPAIVPSLASSTTPLQKLVLKRKQTSHLNKMERQQKRSKTSNLLKAVKVMEYPKIAPKVLTSPPIETVKEIIQKSTGKPQTTTTTTSALQSLFGNCNINIPSSLSITLKETSSDTVMTPIKPVINHIEILKLPDSPFPPVEVNGRLTTSEESSAKMTLDRLDVTVSTITINTQATTTKVGVHPNLPAKVAMPANSREIKTAPMNSSSSSSTTQAQRLANNSNSSSFQRMFEEAIKKPEFTQKIHAYPVKQLKEDVVSTVASSEVPAAPVSPNTPASTSTKRNLMEIATQLSQSKKSKVEAVIPPKPATPPLVSVPQQVSAAATAISMPRLATVLPKVNANGKVAIPRLPPSWKSSVATSSIISNSSVLPHQTVANLHSASLGINYTVSINQQNTNGTINAKVNTVDSPKHAKSPSQSYGAQMSYAELTQMKPEDGITMDLSKPMCPNGTVLPLPPKVSSPRISTSTSPTLLNNGFNRDSTHSELVPLNLKSPSHHDNLITAKDLQISPISESHGSLVAPSQSTDITPPVINGVGKLTKPLLKTTGTNKKKPSKPHKKHSTNNNNQPLSAPAPILNPNELLEKYNIQNLAQLTAGWNLGTQLMASAMVAPPSLTFQQAMLLKHFEIQNRQNWLNSTTNHPLMAEYKKYLQQTLNAAAAAQQQIPTPAHALKEN